MIPGLASDVMCVGIAWPRLLTLDFAASRLDIGCPTHFFPR